eukprot:gi/632980806/ref/XP_007907241.1/ PREDICTED: probable G-protein coupled receptor 21 [Callorhinchus milii]
MTSVWTVQNRSLNYFLEGNNSSRPFCLFGFSYYETVNICLLEVIIIVFLTVLIISGFIVVLLYAPAAFVVCFTYFNIFRICQQHTKEISDRRARFSSPEGESTENPPYSEKHYAMVLFRITSVFYILWLPYIIYFLLESSRTYNSAVISFLTTWLAISNSFCNCVIYSLSNSVFRKGLRRLSGAVCAVCIWHVEGKTPSAPGTVAFIDLRLVYSNAILKVTQRCRDWTHRNQVTLMSPYTMDFHYCFSCFSLSVTFYVQNLSDHPYVQAEILSFAANVC